MEVESGEMPNPENLKPLNTIGKDEAKKIRQKGQAAQIKAIKERKTLKETLLLLLSEGKTQDNITLALIQKALNGDVKAFEVIRDTIGQKPVDEVKAINTTTIKLDNKDVKKYAKELQDKLRG